MAKHLKTFTTRVSGFLSPRHTVIDEDGKEIGVIQVRRNRLGMIVSGTWTPEKGEVLVFKRQPGLLRAQFACWTEAREWLGSSIRPGVMRRTVEISTGAKSVRLVPRLALGRGWRVVGAKSALVAQIDHGWLNRGAKIETFKKFDLELLLFSYFLGGLALWESALPTALEAVDRGTPQTARG